MKKIRVMTYNIQHGHVHLDNHIDLTKVCDVIREYDPDIVGLNEVRGRGKRDDYTAQVETMAAYLGYHCYFGRSICINGSEPYGNAVLSKYPIIEASVIRIPNPVDEEALRKCEPRSLCRAVIEIPIDGEAGAYSGAVTELAVYASHFGLTEVEQEHAVSTALTCLSAEPRPFLLMGDFNMQPDAPLMQPLHRSLNSVDPLIEGKMSFPSDSPRIKIDYIYASRDITFIDADVPQIVASDHCPIWADVIIGRLSRQT